MTEPVTMQVSKLDAGKRQLETAIRLFFSMGDPISTHTLTMAAHDLLADLAKSKGLPGGFKAEMLKSIRPEKQDEVRDLLNRDQNFFKHADRDPDEVTDFPPRVTRVFLWYACGDYSRLTGGEQTPLMSLFGYWIALAHPEWIADEQIKPQLKEAAKTLQPENRRAFLDLLPLIERKLSGTENKQGV